MSINIRYPNITALSEKEQLAQVKSYLHQLVDQLNYALSTLGAGDGQKNTSTSSVQYDRMRYRLTEEDKTEIVQAVIDALEEKTNQEE
jgi:hypothetical protein